MLEKEAELLIEFDTEGDIENTLSRANLQFLQSHNNLPDNVDVNVITVTTEGATVSVTVRIT